jgi:photosystem II stability/assembly factor-like uncharacterized protein
MFAPGVYTENGLILIPFPTDPGLRSDRPGVAGAKAILWQQMSSSTSFSESLLSFSRIHRMRSFISPVIRRALAVFSFTLPLSVLDAQSPGQVMVVQKTPPELADFGISFEKLNFTFESPVTARFWIECEMGEGKRSHMDVPHDYALPTSHYALSYLQLANDQVSVSVTTDAQPPENRRTAMTDAGDGGSGTRIVTYQLSAPRVDYDQDIELFRATTKPSWRHPRDPSRVVRIMTRFSAAEFPVNPIPMEDNAGWEKVTKGRLAILHRGRNSFDWKDVSPKALADVAKGNPDASFWGDLVDLSAVSANEAWVAIAQKEGDKTQGRLEHTTDGGKTWREATTPAADAVKLSFVDSRCGFLLALGSPSAGLMKKAVYGTVDGGAHWQPLAAPGADGQSFYPTGICFRTPQEGWMTATYHGAPAVPLFHTRDGGQSWQVQELEIPADFQGGYADIYPPFFYPRQINPDLKKGQLPVKLVRHPPAPDHEAWIYYRTDDGGATWQLPKPKEPTSEN